MDLRKMKTVFIIVLILVNIMLSAVIYGTKSEEREIDKEMGNSISYFLQKNMIYLAPKLDIPKPSRVYNYYLERMSENNDLFVGAFLGGEYQTDGGGVYRSGDKLLSVGGNEFKYENAKPREKIVSFDAKAVEELCRGVLKRIGINPRLYEFGGVNYIDDKMKVIFTLRYDESVFFDAYISFDVSKDGIVAITGKNLVSDITVSGRASTYFSVNSILMDIVKNPILDKNIRHTIVSIKSGYYIGGNTGDYRNILAIPVWQIATDTGNILYYDARNGNYISEK